MERHASLVDSWHIGMALLPTEQPGQGLWIDAASFPLRPREDFIKMLGREL